LQEELCISTGRSYLLAASVCALSFLAAFKTLLPRVVPLGQCIARFEHVKKETDWCTYRSLHGYLKYKLASPRGWPGNDGQMLMLIM